MHRGNLGCCHFVFFSHEVVKQLGLSGFEAVYSKAGRSAYSPELLLKVWLYVCPLGITSPCKLEQRLHEDLVSRSLADNHKPCN